MSRKEGTMGEIRYCADMVDLTRDVRDGVYGPAGDEHLLALHLDTCRQCWRAYQRDQREAKEKEGCDGH